MTSSYPSGPYYPPPQTPPPGGFGPQQTPLPGMPGYGPSETLPPGTLGYGPPPTPPRRRNVTALLGGFAAGVLVAGLTFGGLALANSGGHHGVAGTGSVQALPSLPQMPNLRLPNGLQPNSGSGSGNNGVTAATAKQQIGLVTVTSVLKYQTAESAGTGMILTSDGDVLTNNHVIDGATRITVTVESTGHSYRANVVGTAPTRDVALLKLQGASGLQTAALASSSSALSVGAQVTGVGNAGGTGRLTQVSGTVTGLNKTITASDDNGANAERLHGLIQTNAGIIAGDSGGPLYDAAGQVVGMDTAAAPTSANESAYAIPVENAMKIVQEIDTGVETSSIHIGLPGFLGISVTNTHGGVGVQGLLRGGPAAGAGITGGSVIKSVDGTPVRTPTGLHNLLSVKGPGAHVTVRWIGANGRAHIATVTLATGPAD
jgi:S1-C subfamily serine protease